MPALTMTERLITGPAMEPIDIDEFKRSIKVTTTSEDTLIDTDISAARQYFEMRSGWQIMSATYEAGLACFPSGAIELPRMPVLEVQSVTYPGSTGDVTLIEETDFTVHASNGLNAARGWLELPYGGQWPTVSSQLNAVRVRYTAGFGTTPGDVPELVRKMVTLIAGDFYKYRTQSVERNGGVSFVVHPWVEFYFQNMNWMALSQQPATVPYGS